MAAAQNAAQAARPVESVTLLTVTKSFGVEAVRVHLVRGAGAVIVPRREDGAIGQANDVR